MRGEDSSLPSTWTMTRIGDLCTALQYGYTASAVEAPRGPRLLRITDIQEGAVAWASVPYCEIEKERIGKYLLHPGDIVFARTGGTVGKSYIISSVPEPSVFASYLIRLTAHYEVFPKFLYYFFQSASYWEQIGLKKGGLQGNVNATTLSSLEIPVCPLNEQRRIVAKIEELFSELDKGVEALIAAREQLSAYRQSVLKYAFDGSLSEKWRKGRKLNAADIDLGDEIPPDELTGFPELPGGWTHVRLGHFLDRVDAGKSFRCEERIPGEREIGVAKVSAVTWGEYSEDESKTCTDPEKVNPRYFIKEGDFLFSRANTIELVGACVIAKRVSRKVMLSDKTLRLVFRDLPAHFFLYYLRSHLGRMEIMRRSTGNQESMRNIGQDRIKSIVIPMCSAEEADYIQGKIQGIFSSIDYVEGSLQTELDKSNPLRQSILKEAFSGRLVEQDPKDEPATALLERIRTERAVKTTKKEHSTKNGRKKAA